MSFERIINSIEVVGEPFGGAQGGLASDDLSPTTNNLRRTPTTLSSTYSYATSRVVASIRRIWH